MTLSGHSDRTRQCSLSEWPWSYVFLAVLLFLFALEGACRSLGLDAWLCRKVPSVRDRKRLLGWVLHAAS
jgi:hypothetical protein